LTGDAAVILGAAAGALAAIAGREVVAAMPGAAGWVRQSVEPLARAGTEGYAPTSHERRRLALVGTGAAALGGWLVAGPAVALSLSVAGPLIAASAVARRRERYRRAVERALPEVAAAVADSLAAGRSLRSALGAAAESLDGPASVELSRLGAELGLGAPTAEAVAGLRMRLRSERIDAFAAAVLSQRLSGGDLSSLLRRFAEATAERDRAAEDARAATAQARFTGLLVVAMPTGAALFAELMEPGFLGRVVQSPAALVLMAVAGALQVTGFAAIRRLARVAE
jgi:tight adherence protein B